MNRRTKARVRQRIAALTALVLGSGLATGLPLTQARAVTCAATQFATSIYSNQTLTGTPTVTRCDNTINYKWYSASPAAGVPADHFSVRWTRTDTFAAGNYKFDLVGDDGIRLLVDGVDVLDGFHDQGPTAYTVTKAMTAGAHTLEIDYYENAYDATAQFDYTATTTTPVTPPTGTAVNLVGNPYMTTGTGIPACYINGSWGTNTYTAGLSNDVPDGITGRSYNQVVSAYTSGGVKLLNSDAAGCAPTVAAGTTYSMGVYYKSSVAQNAVTIFTENGTGGWQFWTTLANLPASTTWAQYTATLPALPAGTTRLSIGLEAIGTGSLFTTGYSVTVGAGTTSAPPTTPPVTPPSTGLASTGRWTISTLVQPARAMHVTLLDDGRLLEMAGSGNNSANFAAGTFTTKILDPTTGAVTNVPTPSDMFCSEHVTLSNGNVLVMGGTNTFPGVNGATVFTGLRSSYIFDPRTNVFTKINDANGGHWYPTMTKLANGDVWAAGGLADGDPTGKTTTVSTNVELYSAAQNKWLPTSGIKQDNVYWGEYPAMFLLTNGNLFYTGSHVFGNQRVGTGASLLNINAGTIGDVPGLTNKDLRDAAGSVLLPPAQNQTVLIAGGGHLDAGSAPTNSTAIINLNAANPAYVAGPPLPGPGRQYLNLTTMFDRTVLASDGANGVRTGNLFYASIYNPVTNSWTTDTPADPVGRNYHSTSVLLPDGRVMNMGSNPADGSWETKISIYEPPYLFKEATRPTVTTATTDTTYGATLSLATTGMSNIVSASLTTPESVTHQMDSNDRLVDLPITGSGNNWTATVPTNPNLLPPGPYMLTVLDAAGVPSVAKWINVK